MSTDDQNSRRLNQARQPRKGDKKSKTAKAAKKTDPKLGPNGQNFDPMDHRNILMPEMNEFLNDPMDKRNYLT